MWKEGFINKLRYCRSSCVEGLKKAVKILIRIASVLSKIQTEPSRTHCIYGTFMVTVSNPVFSKNITVSLGNVPSFGILPQTVPSDQSDCQK
jgi:hypothetical protein